MASRPIGARLRVVVIASMVAAGMALAPSVSASSPHALHFTKNCNDFSGVAPTFCTIDTSNIDAIEPGSKVWYYGPVVAFDAPYTDSFVVIRADSGTANGYCHVSNTTALGTCLFWSGTGALRGFRAYVHVSVPDFNTFEFNWDGWYLLPGN